MSTTNAGRIVDAPTLPVVRIAVEDLTAHLETLESELSGGRAIEILRGQTVIAEVRAPQAKTELETRAGLRPLPDFMARLREIYGDTPLDVDTTEWIREGRRDASDAVR